MWKPKWLKRIIRDRRGREIDSFVPAMLEYVQEYYEPLVQYSIGPFFGEKDTIEDMKEFAKEAEKDMALYDSPAMENTYHEWEKKNSEHKSFSSEVVRMVNEKYEKASDFYRAANIDKRTYHKIKTEYDYVPSRITAFRCCIGLQLSVEEAEELLSLAGMAFSPREPDDLVLKFCLENGIRDIPGVNYMMYKYAVYDWEKRKGKKYKP